MLREHEPPKEPASDKARRKWHNATMRERFKEADQKKLKLIDNDLKKEPEIADVVENEGRRHGTLSKFESAFIKEMRGMLEGHADKNLMIYAALVHNRKRKLLREKLRRLEARQAAQQKPRDLFA
jgi:hypothetical protein